MLQKGAFVAQPDAAFSTPWAIFQPEKPKPDVPPCLTHIEDNVG